jgi:hypothetical protein
MIKPFEMSSPRKALQRAPRYSRIIAAFSADCNCRIVSASESDVMNSRM